MKSNTNTLTEQELNKTPENIAEDIENLLKSKNKKQIYSISKQENYEEALKILASNTEKILLLSLTKKQNELSKHLVLLGANLTSRNNKGKNPFTIIHEELFNKKHDHDLLEIGLLILERITDEDLFNNLSSQEQTFKECFTFWKEASETSKMTELTKKIEKTIEFHEFCAEEIKKNTTKIPREKIEYLRKASIIGDVDKIINISNYITTNKIFNTKDSSHKNALHHATFHNHPDSVKVLLDQGSDASQKDREGNTSFMLANKRANQNPTDDLAIRCGLVILSHKNSTDFKKLLPNYFNTKSHLSIAEKWRKHALNHKDDAIATRLATFIEEEKKKDGITDTQINTNISKNSTQQTHPQEKSDLLSMSCTSPAQELAQKELAQQELTQQIKELEQQVRAQKELTQQELAQKELAHQELTQQIKKLAQQIKELEQQAVAQQAVPAQVPSWLRLYPTQQTHPRETSDPLLMSGTSPAQEIVPQVPVQPVHTFLNDKATEEKLTATAAEEEAEKRSNWGEFLQLGLRSDTPVDSLPKKNSAKAPLSSAAISDQPGADKGKRPAENDSYQDKLKRQRSAQSSYSPYRSL